MYFVGFIKTETQRYKITKRLASRVTEKEKQLLMLKDGVVRYCLSKLSIYQSFFSIALQILATPPSSASSERNFSLLKLTLPNRRLLHKDEIVEDVKVLQYAKRC